MCQTCHHEVIGSKGGKKNLILMVNLNLRSPQAASSLGEMRTVRGLLNRNFQWLGSKASLSSASLQAGLAGQHRGWVLRWWALEAADCLSVGHPLLLLSWLLLLKSLQLKSLWNKLLIFQLMIWQMVQYGIADEWELPMQILPSWQFFQKWSRYRMVSRVTGRCSVLLEQVEIHQLSVFTKKNPGGKRKQNA